MTKVRQRDERRTKTTKTIKAPGRRRGSQEPASQAAKGTASPPRLATTTGYHYWLNGERERERERKRREREREREERERESESGTAVTIVGDLK